MHCLNNYVFVMVLKLGTMGSGLSSSLTNLFICLTFYFFSKCNQDENFQKVMSVPLFRSENLVGFTSYLKLGLPVLVIMVIDWGSYEVLSLMSAKFGVITQTSLILVWNWCAVIY